jgi:RNA polymerase sigma-70 factor (ECF subfamily)
MLEDELLKLRFVLGSTAALARIYQKYANTLLTLAMALLNDASTAEDVVHDVFVRFAQSSGRFRLGGSLKSYLTTCLVNRARDVIRHQNQRTVSYLDKTIEIQSPDSDPVETIIGDELANQANEALARLPYEQREVIILYIKTDMSLKQIAELQEVPMRTVQGRYRRGLEKLRKTLAKEVRL